MINLVIKDHSGQSYELTARTRSPRTSSAKRYSSDSYSTFRFVARLPVTLQQWMQILNRTHHSANFHSSHPGEVYQAVAQCILRGDLAIYKLPTLAAAGALKGKNGFGLCIIKGPNPHIATDLIPEVINTTDAAQQLFNQLGISSQLFLAYLNSENLYNTNQKQNPLADALHLFATGELLAYKIPLPPKAPPAKAAEFLPATAADRPVPLAPEGTRNPEEIETPTQNMVSPTVESKEKNSDVISDEDETKKATYDEFCSTVEEFEVRNALSEQAYAMYTKEQWNELEALFNDNNLNGGWPPNRGAISTSEITLQIDTQIDRYGGFIDRNTGQFRDFGTFVSYKGEPFENRALPPDTKSKTMKSYTVVKPIPKVNAGKAIPWFNQAGLGTQLETPLTIEDLVSKGYLKEV
ncbi:TNT domain-containing protein [Cellvibrio sp. QJXJ]|uniref:TNT domain-containing protein n=1 Tax=Cellvibrio sp. QJXJ TaxID=2964606 RepID=UPI0021C40271|nr:TNT domain-containing protein [Cellvibrio sp. QJXJ]UUA71160.1 TNT domain-containing protein [Cellvibrio sp. QJXJ]